MNNYFDLKWEKNLGHEEELVFKKILSVESILSHFFIQFQFSCVILTEQIFMSFLFHIESKDLINYLVKNLILESLQQTNKLPLSGFQKQFSVIRDSGVVRH